MNLNEIIKRIYMSLYFFGFLMLSIALLKSPFGYFINLWVFNEQNHDWGYFWIWHQDKIFWGAPSIVIAWILNGSIKDKSNYVMHDNKHGKFKDF
jgi:hypothetical protein